MTGWIVSFIVIGAVFGMATYSKRHLFNEGSTRRSGAGERDPLDTRIAWVLTCTALWPIFALAGMYSFLRRARLQARQPRDGAD